MVRRGLSEAREGNEQVKNTAPREECCRRIWNPKEYSPNHDSLEHERHDLGNLSCRVALENLEPSNHDRPRLHWDRDDVGTLLAGGGGVFCPCTLPVCRGAFRFADGLVEVSVHVILVDLPDVRLAVVLYKFIRGPRHSVFISLTTGTSVGVGDCDEEVRSSLPVGWLVSHVDEVLAGERSWTVVDHSAFEDDTDFIEEVVHILRSLVNRHGGRHFGNVGANAKSLDELECGRGIETSS